MASASPFDDLINKHAQLTGLDPNLVKAVITRESNFNPNARSPKDARGLMQVIPSTAKLMGVNPSRLYEPEQSIIAGTRYLAFLSKRFNGDFTKMVAGYNAGHGAVEKFGGIPLIVKHRIMCALFLLNIKRLEVLHPTNKASLTSQLFKQASKICLF